MSEEETENNGENLTWLNDVPLKLTVELGQGKITIRDLLKLKDGSIIDLDKLAGEPLELFVNDKLVSRGEVVVSNDHYAIRLTDVISDVDTKESEE
ncbi:MAG: flagellar motor switch protein FliN [Bdellovibrionales bacterium]|jgi:flagellar motor switch protein FliN|nr:flagellar motor switch protein FliN [Bdellovibrionales bacterium]